MGFRSRAAEHGGQLGLYAEAIEIATGRKCQDLLIHMPLVGALLRLGSSKNPACI